MYEYDNHGNITFKKIYNYTEPDTPIGTTLNPKKIVKYTYKTTGWTDQLEKVELTEGGVTTVLYNMSYDDQGNPTTYGGWTFTWFGRQLETATKSGNTISYEYNDQGIRISKTVGSVVTNYYLEGDKVVYETDGTNVIYYTYDVDGTLISMNLNGVEYFYIRNMQGDIVELVDTAGNIVVSYSYDAWGNILNKDEIEANPVAKANPYRYRGYRYDEETGWYYLNSRYYNPEIGRFINADGQIGQPGDILGHNMYAYAMNNPVMYVDPSGYFFEEIGDWFNDRLDDLTDWLNEKPRNVNDSSSLGFGATVSSWIAGWSIGGGEGTLGGLMKRTYTWTNAYNGLSGVKGYIGTIGTGIMIFSTLFDLADTWQADNSNTNGDRINKSLIQVGGTYINFTIAAWGVGAITTAVAGGAAILSAPVLVPAAIIVGTGIGVYYGSKYLYDKMGIE